VPTGLAELVNRSRENFTRSTPIYLADSIRRLSGWSSCLYLNLGCLKT